MMSGRKPLLAGNWKMHKTPGEAVEFVTDLKNRIAGVEDRDVLVAPPFPALTGVAEALQGTRIFLAGQNLHWEEQGAFTGEVSAPMLRAAGCTHVIVGHSERRRYFGETDPGVAKKAHAAFAHGLLPIICVGETLEQREGGETLTVVERQVRGALAHLDQAQTARAVLAYEPVWAIGTGKVASPAQAQEVHAAIRAVVAGVTSKAVAEAVRILYGGSVKAGNVDDLMRQPDLDGALVGGASLKADDFARIVRFSV